MKKAHLDITEISMRCPHCDDATLSFWSRYDDDFIQTCENCGKKFLVSPDKDIL